MTRCPDPYDVERDASFPDTITWRPEYHEELVMIPFIEAEQWRDDFSITADITTIGAARAGCLYHSSIRGWHYNRSGHHYGPDFY